MAPFFRASKQTCVPARPRRRSTWSFVRLSRSWAKISASSRLSSKFFEPMTMRSAARRGVERRRRRRRIADPTHPAGQTRPAGERAAPTGIEAGPCSGEGHSCWGEAHPCRGEGLPCSGESPSLPGRGQPLLGRKPVPAGERAAPAGEKARPCSGEGRPCALRLPRGSGDCKRNRPCRGTLSAKLAPTGDKGEGSHTPHLQQSLYIRVRRLGRHFLRDPKLEEAAGAHDADAGGDTGGLVP